MPKRLVVSRAMPTFRTGAIPGEDAPETQNAPSPAPASSSAVPTPKGKQGVDFDAHQASIVAPADATRPLPVYNTKKRWTALDVYIDTTNVDVTPGLNGYGCIVVQAFAVTKGVRVLVASGRFGPDELAASKKLIAYRGGSERYEVVAWQVDGALGATPAPFSVAVIASNIDVKDDDEDEIGIIALPRTGVLTNANGVALGIATDLAQSIELVKVFAVSSVAGRFLNFTSTSAGGTILSLPVTAPGSPGMWNPGRNILKAAPGDVTIGVSSTARTDTPVTPTGDTGWAVYYR